jgi:sugar-specific transcriptional regulator TrmB
MAMSPQAQEIYKVLLKTSRPLYARELAIQLKLIPTVVYRLTEELLNLGLIAKSSSYPSQFMAKPINDGLSLFLLHQNKWFSKEFRENLGTVPNNEISKIDPLSFNFIQSRDELMKISAIEADKTVKSIDLLRSGHEIPPETMLSIIEAKKRGIITRMLIQDYSGENADQVANWKQNGILVKKSALKHIRLMIYDSEAIYFMSYKHSESEKDMGIKITYPPFAAILSQLFEEWWKEAETI